ncbi:alpha-D-ribose 1-methylphosphonate 5-triphosphate diphosphatase [Rhizobium skierniewicense]|uniref:alpha-D-ribose 1-methylphosphonate 5-triphosphate diphosphatase n=1 Tax=Rhizobium skierniewicense TaxID=984260 RepID=UPI001571FED9|nr:alpha-D-ribose 1-methylphosphonate 5-triphosphate diphosphatase [Rhizobium skierniewicense]NTF30607.1 alpha-D-ribose 1-methylphosphonate 5-triphosphate diphosphatase [Rhizobium skierniewicense]
MTEHVFSNARIVLEEQIIKGSLLVRDGLIVDISDGSSKAGEDMEGDFLIPGLVELHTDHLEQHYSPRPGVTWNKTAAIQAHDAQVASSGITTVFDCLRLGSDEDGGFKKGEMRDMADAIEHAQSENRLRADHLLHLRCEVAAADVLDHFEDFEDDPKVRLISLMDHSPGQRQFQTMDQYIMFYQKKRGLSDEVFKAFVDRRVSASQKYSAQHRDFLAARCAEHGITVASHDDATDAHVEEAIGHGVKLAEFPTSVEAAKASHSAGMSVLMGAPNIVRGKSHSGNIAARDLAELGVLDVLSSDYVPFSLLYAPFLLVDQVEGMTLPKAISMVTATPARTVSLDDRGHIAPGLRADLVRVHRDDGVPVVRSVWRQGRRVA